MRLAKWVGLQPKWTWPVWLVIFAAHLIYFDITWFSIDQARDVLQASDIASGRHFPLNGPLMRWIAHIGPLYYYFLALPFLIYSNAYSAYVFLALVATMTVAGGYYFLKRYFSPRAGVLFVALYAPSTFVLMDSRALWTPAFLPFWTLLALVSVTQLLWEKRESGLVVLAAVVGMATQFHLSFVLVVPVCLVLYGLHRPRIGLRTFFMAAVAGLLTYAPYLYFQATHGWTDIKAFLTFAGGGSQAATLAAPASFPARLFRFHIIPAYLGEHWLQLPGGWLQVYKVVASACAVLLVAAFVFLTARVVRIRKQQPDAAQKRALILIWYAVVLVLLLGRSAELYYYYFDLLLPLPFLLLAVSLDDAYGLLPAWVRSRYAAAAAACCLASYIFIQAGAYFYWIRTTEQGGLFPLTLEQLDLHRFYTSASRIQDTFMPLRYKTRIAEILTLERGWSRSEIYDKVFGSRFYDATEEGGYWLQQTGEDISRRFADEPVVLWHRSDPLEMWSTDLGIRVQNLGPFRLGQLEAAGTPLRWLAEDGPELRMPLRTIPDPRVYGFVGEREWSGKRVQLRSHLDLPAKPQRYLLVIITKGDQPLPQLAVNSRACSAAATHKTLMTSESYYWLDSFLAAGQNRLDLLLEHQRNFDLEVFGWAKW